MYGLDSAFRGSFITRCIVGCMQGRRDGFSFSVLLVAPIFSAVLIVGAIMAMTVMSAAGILSGPPVNPNHSLVLTVSMWLASAFLYGSGIFLYGAVPALLGSAAGQLGKLWVVHRDSGIRRIGRGRVEERASKRPMRQQSSQARPGISSHDARPA
jgi:hypothetical protein